MGTLAILAYTSSPRHIEDEENLLLLATGKTAGPARRFEVLYFGFGFV
jgi:hypothetical protein